MNTSVAGLSMVLPSQNAVAAAAEALRRRSPMTTGTAQHVHIIPGIANKPPVTTLRQLERPKTRAIQAMGANSCRAAPSSRPRTMACQMALP